MKIKITLLFLFIKCSIGFSQIETPIDFWRGTLEFQKFVLKNLDSIKNNCGYDTIYFNAKGDNKLTKIGFYNDKSLNIYNKIAVWKPLNDYAEILFSFIPDMNSGYRTGETEVNQIIILNKKALKKSIKLIEKNLKNSNRNYKEIQQYSTFTLNIEKFYLNEFAGIPDSLIYIDGLTVEKNPIEIKGLEFESKLECLNSNIIWLNANTCITFRIIKTSYEGILQNSVEIFIYFNNILIDQQLRDVYKSVVNFGNSSSIDDELFLDYKIQIRFI